jgi:hypothetical protein
MPDKAAIMALAYLDLHEAGGEVRFRQAAEAIGKSLSLRQREDGTWPFRVDPKTEAVIEDYSSSVIYAVMLFEKLDKINGNDRYRANRDKTWNWLVNGPIKTKEFRGFYEDIPASKDGRTNYDCLDTIRYLLANRTDTNGYLEMAKDLNAWVEKTFMDKIKDFEPAEGIREQLQCNVVMGIHSLNWASIPSTTAITVYRKTKSSTTWGTAVTVTNFVELMSESLRNDGRIWVPKRKEDCKKNPADIAEGDRDYYLERMYSAFGNLAPRDVASRAAKYVCDEGRGIGDTGLGVYLDFGDSIRRLGEGKVRERYGNLFSMYHEITNEDAYKTPMRIYPAVHYTMGGLWVDYNLMSNIPGLFVLGEANFSDHGANRLGASALMQGLSDGYFVLPSTITTYLANVKAGGRPATDRAEFQQAEEEVRNFTRRVTSNNGKRSPDSFHKQLGKIMWDYCGMARTETGLQKAIQLIGDLREEFRTNVKVLGEPDGLNQPLEKAGRVADFIELGELMCRDALMREESCGGHFREEYQYTPNDPEVQQGVVNTGDVKRRDDQFAFVAAWEYAGAPDKAPILNKEPLIYEEVKMSTRSYK